MIASVRLWGSVIPARDASGEIGGKYWCVPVPNREDEVGVVREAEVEEPETDREDGFRFMVGEWCCERERFRFGCGFGFGFGL